MSKPVSGVGQEGSPPISNSPQHPTPAENQGVLEGLGELSQEFSRKRGSSFPGVVPQLLHRMLDVFSADRCCLFQYSAKGKFINLAWESSKPSIPPMAPLVSGLPGTQLALLGSELEEKGFAHFDSISDLKEMGESERKFFLGNDIASLIASSMGAPQSGNGFLLLGRRVPGPWTAPKIQGLQILSPLLTAKLDHAREAHRLEEIDQNLNSLMENIDDVLLILDPAGRILHANRAAVECSGYSLTELRSHLFTDLLPPVMRSRALKWLSRASEAPASFFPFIDRNGRETPVESRLSVTRWSGQDVLLVLGRDITARIQALKGLKKHQSESTAIINALPDLVLRLDEEANLLQSWNIPAEGQASSTHFIQRLISVVETSINEILKRGQMKVLETRIPSGGETTAYECRVVPLEGREVLVLARDISQARMIEQMKSEFINTISHDLRTPLTTARLMVDLLRGGDDENADEYWTILSEELQRQNDLIGDLLTMSRLERGRIDVDCVRMDPRPVLDSVLEQLRPRASEKGLNLKENIDLQGRLIAGDHKALNRVLINLLDNAFKFSEPGHDVLIEAHEDENHLIIGVTDQGIGIEEDALQRIYDRFFRSSRAIKLGTTGCGVGLYLVKAIIEAHHGTIEVKSSPGQGSTFKLSIPLLETTS